jgi:hypothetical protein
MARRLCAILAVGAAHFVLTFALGAGWLYCADTWGIDSFETRIVSALQHVLFFPVDYLPIHGQRWNAVLPYLNSFLCGVLLVFAFGIWRNRHLSRREDKFNSSGKLL